MFQCEHTQNECVHTQNECVHTQRPSECKHTRFECVHTRWAPGKATVDHVYQSANSESTCYLTKVIGECATLTHSLKRAWAGPSCIHYTRYRYSRICSQPSWCLGLSSGRRSNFGIDFEVRKTWSRNPSNCERISLGRRLISFIIGCVTFDLSGHLLGSSCFDGIRYGTRNLTKIYCTFDSV